MLNEGQIKKTHDASWESLYFPDALKGFMDGGVTYYYADFITDQKIYYNNNGESLALKGHGTFAIGNEFKKEDVAGAIKKIQQKQLSYQEWVKTIMAAGCFGYFVFIEGRHCLYLGQKGEQHIEPFLG